jgi:alpha-N-arabinofuranosidase
MTGSFTWRDEFDEPGLRPAWNSLRGPGEGWYRLDPSAGSLVLRARPVALTSREVPSFLGRRQQHARFVATTALRVPREPGWSAGLVAFQNETHHFYLGARRGEEGPEVLLERVADREADATPATVAVARLPEGAGGADDIVVFRIEGHDRIYSFSFATTPEGWRTLKEGEDGSILSTARAGGFVGTYLGLHARLDARQP